MQGQSQFKRVAIFSDALSRDEEYKPRAEDVTRALPDSDPAPRTFIVATHSTYLQFRFR